MEPSENGNSDTHRPGASANGAGAHMNDSAATGNGATLNGNGPHANGAAVSENAGLSAKRRLGLAFGPTYEEATLGLPNYWYPVMFSVQIGKRPKALKILGQEIVLTRVKKKVYVLENRCPHVGIPLHNGRF